MTNCSSISSIVWFQLPPRSKPYTNQHSTNPSICIESRFRKKNGAMVIFSETDLLFIFKKIRVFPLILYNMTWQMEISAKSNFAVSFVMIGCVCVCSTYLHKSKNSRQSFAKEIYYTRHKLKSRQSETVFTPKNIT